MSDEPEHTAYPIKQFDGVWAFFMTTGDDYSKILIDRDEYERLLKLTEADNDD